MYGHSFWRPVIVGAVLGGFIVLPRGDTVPPTLDAVSCAQLAAEVRDNSRDCQSQRYDVAAGQLVGMASPVAGAAAGSLPAAPAAALPAPVVPAPAAVPAAPAAPEPVAPAPVAPQAVVPAPVVPVDPAPVVPAPVVPAPTVPAAEDGDEVAGSPESDEESESDGDAREDSDDSGTANPSSSSPAANPAGAAGGTIAAATLGAASCPTTAGTAAAAAPAALGAGALDGTAVLPAGVIDLASWYLTLPTGQAGDPDTVQNPALASFANEFFRLNDTRDGVVFSARGDGVTTKNSKYPRSELREMSGGELAAWSNTSGSHVLDVCEAITKVPGAKPEVVAAQIHDGNDDVMQIRLEGRTLMVQYNDGGSSIVIDPNYVLGTPYNLRLAAADGKVDIYYNGQHRVQLTGQGSGWYWKVGAYVQSNTSKGDGAGAVGEVVVYSLRCAHA